MSEIILTADRTLMSDYGKCEFLGFAACAPKLMPEWLFRALICPPVPHKNGIALYAPGGTRKIEAALLKHGFDVVVAHPDHLNKVIDEDTKAVGITTNDPLGLGPASSTFTGLIGREPYSAIHFKKLVENLICKKDGMKIVVGGPGAWQLADEEVATKLGIDCVIIGEGEITAVKIFEHIVSGKDLPRIVEG